MGGVGWGGGVFWCNAVFSYVFRDLFIQINFPEAKGLCCAVQIWCHPTSNPWAAPLTWNNGTSLSLQRQHQWWFHWHMERSHICKPCSQELCNWFELNILSKQHFKRQLSQFRAGCLKKNKKIFSYLTRWCLCSNCLNKPNKHIIAE